MLSRVFEIENLNDIIESEIEKKINNKYNLNIINEEEEEIWKDIVRWREEAVEFDNLGKEYQKEVDELENKIVAAKKTLNGLNLKYIKKVEGTGLQCSRLTRRRSGQDSIMFENPDGAICWMSIPKEAKKLDLPTIDLYGDKEARQREIEKIDAFAREHADELKKNEFEKQELTYEEKIIQRVEDFDKSNRRKEDTEEISNLWDYWKIIKTSQLFAGIEGDNATCYTADLDLIKQGYRHNDCLDDEELILLGDEMQRVSDEVKKLRKDKKPLKYEEDPQNDKRGYCECGNFADCGYFKEGKLFIGCESCCKINKEPFEFLCGECRQPTKAMRYVRVNRDGFLICGKCYGNLKKDRRI